MTARAARTAAAQQVHQARAAVGRAQSWSCSACARLHDKPGPHTHERTEVCVYDSWSVMLLPFNFFFSFNLGFFLLRLHSLILVTIAADACAGFFICFHLNLLATSLFLLSNCGFLACCWVCFQAQARRFRLTTGRLDHCAFCASWSHLRWLWCDCWAMFVVYSSRWGISLFCMWFCSSVPSHLPQFGSQERKPRSRFTNTGYVPSTVSGCTYVCVP